MHPVVHLPYGRAEPVVHGLHVGRDGLELLQNGRIDAGGGMMVIVNFLALGDGAGELREELGDAWAGSGSGSGGVRGFEARVDAGHD